MRTPARTRGNQAEHMQVPGEAHATHKPASGQRDHPGLHQNCCPSGSRTLPAVAATLLKTQPCLKHSQKLRRKWLGRAGSSAGKRWRCWLRPHLNLLPINCPHPPSFRGQPSSFLTTTPQQPQACALIPGGCPGGGEIQVRFTARAR